MPDRRTVPLLVVACLLLGACTEVVASDDTGSSGSAGGGIPGVDVSSVTSGPSPTAARPSNGAPSTSDAAGSTDANATAAPSDATVTTDATSTTASATSTTSPTSTTSTTSTTTTTVPELDVYDPFCVVQVAPGDSLGLIADGRDDELLTVASLQAENGLDSEVIQPGQLLDVCVDNGLDDVTGEQRLERNAAIVADETRVAVEAQQAKLNELLTPFGFPAMPVDGISGPVTRRGLCAARLALGLPVTLTDMEPGSEEEQALLAAPALPIPFNVAAMDPRWVLIDQTCQVMFVGEGVERLVFVFPTSTGEAGHETRNQQRSRAFRYDPALRNGGWHNSSTYPVAIDNPLNGNMYRPIYFDGGQAIHGANTVPTSPQSKGCARLRPEHQNALVGWLGLEGVGGPVWSRDRINLSVTVQGAYAG